VPTEWSFWVVAVLAAVDWRGVISPVHSRSFSPKSKAPGDYPGAFDRDDLECQETGITPGLSNLYEKKICQAKLP